MKYRLVSGHRYDVQALRCVGWTEGDGSGHAGYDYLAYFEADGTYRGADAHGIEPVIETGHIRIAPPSTRRAELGSVSSGTLRPEDLIPAFMHELRRLRRAVPRDLYQMSRNAVTDDELQELVNALADALQEFAPPYCYFGAHPGDGSDFGFWLEEGALDDFDGLRVDDTSQVPADYSGEVLHVNDHGNATLYNAHRGKLTEVWAVV